MNFTSTRIASMRISSTSGWYDSLRNAGVGSDGRDMRKERLACGETIKHPKICYDQPQQGFDASLALISQC